MIQCLNDMIAYVGNENIDIKDISNVRRKEDFQVEKETLVPFAIILWMRLIFQRRELDQYHNLERRLSLGNRDTCLHTLRMGFKPINTTI